MDAYLIIYGSEPGAPREIDLDAFKNDIISFGRDDDNDIVLSAGFVSRHHGHIRRMANGAYLIEDIGSTNGLLFNEERIISRVLQDGDVIKIDKINDTRKNSIQMAFSNHVNDGMVWKSFTIPPKATQIVIGRGENCDICLEHIGVSRVHAIITMRNGHFFLSDNNSTNGVIVNGKRISKPCRLNEKDLVVITNSKLIFSSTQISYCVQRRGVGLAAFDLFKTVDGGRKVICNGVDIAAQAGELVALVGGSGAGKSTLMNCLSGFNKPTSGDVEVGGVGLYDNYDALKNIIGYVPQADIVHENLSLVDMLGYAAKLRLPDDVSKAERDERIEKVIEIVELVNHKTTLTKNLSGGQRKRASIAVELISDPSLFFLD